jgi:heat shock protein HslJ
MKTFFQIITLVFIVGSCKTTSSSVKPQPENSITEKYWKLIEINGKPVVLDETTPREAFIILKNEDHRVNGNGGCNTLNGTYEISQGNRIKFSQMASTMMACLNMEIENELKRVLEMTDNYSLSDDGKFLSLNRARMAPLARFEAVYLL